MAQTPSTHLEQRPARTRNVGDNERRLSLIGGAVATVAGMRRGGLSGLLMSGLGAALLYRGSTGYCPMNERLGRNSANPSDTGVLGGSRSRAKPANMHAVVTIGRSAAELYEHWRDFSNLGRFMRYIESVRPEPGGRRSHWIAELPMVGRVEWDSEVTADVPGERIAWRSLEGSEIDTSGEVRFRAGPQGTEVEVDMYYKPPGMAGAVAAKLARSFTETILREDLRRFKSIMETGEAPTAAMAQ